MNYDMAVAYCLSRPKAQKDYPFGPQACVIKVKGKMFALISSSGDEGKALGPEYKGCDFINLKCNPDEAVMLRDIFPEVLPGYHMSKKHWNSVVLVDSMPDKEIERLIDRSYGLVVKSLKKSERMQLELLYPESELYR